MNTFVKAAALVSVMILVPAGSASAAKMSRDAAVEQCVAQAQKNMSGNAASMNSSSDSKAGVAVYSACMKKLGFRP